MRWYRQWLPASLHIFYWVDHWKKSANRSLSGEDIDKYLVSYNAEFRRQLNTHYSNIAFNL